MSRVSCSDEAFFIKRLISIIIVIIIMMIIIMIIMTVYFSEPEHNIQVAPLKYRVYKILKSETNFAETETRFTTH